MNYELFEHQTEQIEKAMATLATDAYYQKLKHAVYELEQALKQTGYAYDLYQQICGLQLSLHNMEQEAAYRQGLQGKA